jgi:hypothetical protein
MLASTELTVTNHSQPRGNATKLMSFCGAGNCKAASLASDLPRDHISNM